MRIPASDRLCALGTEGSVAYFHIPVLTDIRAGAAYDEWMNRIQRHYLRKLEPGYTDWAGPLPPAKPLLDITADEVGTYKDRFLLADRAVLFWDYMRRSMGRERFDRWVREVMNAPAMDVQRFYASIQRHAPRLLADARTWLETLDYPDRLRRPAQSAKLRPHR